ncbi:hypothetical protein V8C34DRAFT_302955 [Trichoderma compactum]
MTPTGNSLSAGIPLQRRGKKLVLLDLHRRLIHDLPYEKWILTSHLFIFFVTYTIVQVFTFSECKPFHLYLKVLPDPGPCAQAQMQLIVLGVLNIITDFMLIILPIPVIMKLKAPLARKAQLFALFTLAAIVVNAPTLYLFWNKRRREKSTPRGSTYSGSGGPKRKPTGGIMQTKEVIVSEYRKSGDYIKLPDERDHTAQHSS